MPLFYQQDINDTTRLAVWKIEEPQSFFLAEVPIQSAITHPHKRLQHLAGRYLLKYLFPDFPHHEIEIADTRKPFLPNKQYHFSISHCSVFAAALVSKVCRVGVDVEIITARVENIKHKFLHSEELRFVNSRPVSEHIKHLTLMWCAKESMFKWYGLGDVDFSEHLRILPFALDAEGTMAASVLKDEFQQPLTLQFNLYGDLALVYTITNP